ncbi:MAG: hypothetical protein QXY12_07105, partial [Pyrobaculum sp.]
LKELPYEDVEAICAIGDKGFDARDVMEEFYHRGITSALAVKETFRMGVRDELRKKSKEGYKLYGRDRYLVESLFGTVKQAIGSHFRVKLEDVAMEMALCTMLLYNLYIAVVLGVTERNRNIFRFCSFSHNLDPKKCNIKNNYRTPF